VHNNTQANRRMNGNCDHEGGIKYEPKNAALGSAEDFACTQSTLYRVDHHSYVDQDKRSYKEGRQTLQHIQSEIENWLAPFLQK
jgi:hypothetical protein